LYKFKYHCYHFFLLHEQMHDIIETTKIIQTSNVPHEHIAKTWVNNSQLLLLKYHNYYKDWLQAKDLCDSKIAEVVNDFFDIIHEQWADIDKFRNEIISHAFATTVGSSLTRKQSIFSTGSWINYEIPVESNDYVRLYFHIKNITLFLKDQFPIYWYEFEHKLFPVFPLEL